MSKYTLDEAMEMIEYAERKFLDAKGKTPNSQEELMAFVFCNLDEFPDDLPLLRQRKATLDTQKLEAEKDRIENRLADIEAELRK